MQKLKISLHKNQIIHWNILDNVFMPMKISKGVIKI